MRLLQNNGNGCYSLLKVIGNRIPKYAILSHTWESDDQEVTFQDVEAGLDNGIRKLGYRKIRLCGERAERDGVHHFWVDSCCIDKSSSAELTEAINSMFRWYRAASKCYVYLADVPTADTDVAVFLSSRWFRRGWTLQELLAPETVEFFSSDGKYIGNKQSLMGTIHQATGVPTEVLQQAEGISRYSVEERLSWMARRETTIEEDQAYCMLGIFDVYMPLIYGEGRENALYRLQKEIKTRHARDFELRSDASISEMSKICLAKLVTVDQSRLRFQAIRKSATTCGWISKHPKYLAWRQAYKSTALWISAKAGCGKTTMAAHICQMISSEQRDALVIPQRPQSDSIVLSYFFQNSNDEVLSTASMALATIVRQLVDQVPATLQPLVELHRTLSTNGEFEWSWETLVRLFNTMLASLPPQSTICIILDALDECVASSRSSIVHWTEDLRDNYRTSLDPSRSESTVKILITGRPDRDLIELLPSFSRLEITHTETRDDMRDLIHSRMREFAIQRHLDPAVAKSIVEFLERNAHGMFLWVVLIMKELERRDERLSDEVITSRLSSIPLTLVDTYTTIVRNIPSARRQDTWRVFRWLLFASRTLTLVELEAGLCQELGISSWHGLAGDVKYLCGSLVNSGSLSEEVKFLHPSAQSFLEEYARHVNATDTDGLDLGSQRSNEHLAIVCIRHLLENETSWNAVETLDQLSTHDTYVKQVQQLLSNTPFVRYAIVSWIFHLRVVDKPSTILCALVRELLFSPIRRDNIMLFTFFIDKQGSWEVPLNQTPLHLAAYFNIPWLAHMCISADDKAVHQTSGLLDTPLIWAAETGSTECVEILLDAGADPNAYEIDSWSALHWAARNGHEKIVELLLHRGADASHQDRRGHTPRDWAIDREHFGIVRILSRSLDSVNDSLAGGTSSSSKWLSEKIADKRAHQRPGQLRDHRP